MKLGFFYTALSGLFYGTIGYFGVRLSEIGLSVSDLLFWRFGFSCVLIFPLLLLQWNQIRGSSIRAISLSILLGTALYGFGTSLYFESIKYIGTGLGMVVFFSYPAMVILLSLIFHHQRPSQSTIFALALIIAGCMFIALGKNDGFSADLWGISLAAASGLGYALYIVISKSTLTAMPPLASTFWVCFGSALTFVLEAALNNHSLYWPTSSYVWFTIIAFALIGTVLPIFLFLMGMKYISANQASIISVIEPISVLLVGVFVLNESITGTQLAGAAIILSSAGLVLRSSSTQGRQT